MLTSKDILDDLIKALQILYHSISLSDPCFAPSTRNTLLDLSNVEDVSLLILNDEQQPR